MSEPPIVFLDWCASQITLKLPSRPETRYVDFTLAEAIAIHQQIGLAIAEYESTDESVRQYFKKNSSPPQIEFDGFV